MLYVAFIYGFIYFSFLCASAVSQVNSQMRDGHENKTLQLHIWQGRKVNRTWHLFRPVTHPPTNRKRQLQEGKLQEWSMANRQIPKALVEYTFTWCPFIRNLEKQWSTWEQMSRRNHDEGARVSYNKNMVVIYSTLSENVESNYTEAYIILAN